MKKLRRVRETKGHSMRTLAEELGVNYSLISYWEHGAKEPRPYNKVKLEELLGVPIEELLTDEEE